jgi:hypothetical protein
MTVTVTGVLGQAVYDLLAMIAAWFLVRGLWMACRSVSYRRERRQRDATELETLRAAEQKRYEAGYARKYGRKGRRSR